MTEEEARRARVAIEEVLAGAVVAFAIAGLLFQSGVFMTMAAASAGALIMFVVVVNVLTYLAERFRS